MEAVDFSDLRNHKVMLRAYTVEVSCVSDVSEVYSASIIRVELCRVFLCICRFIFRKNEWGSVGACTPPDQQGQSAGKCEELAHITHLYHEDGERIYLRNICNSVPIITV
jgi:hypothetical protein